MELEQKKSRRCFDKILSTILLVFIIVMVVISVFFTISRAKYGIVKVFGYSVCYVLTGSMEPALKVGEVVLIKEALSDDEISVNDIVTYKSTLGVFNGKYITHRVVGKELQTDGSYSYITRGDANSAIDAEYIDLEKIEGVYQKKIVSIQIFLSLFSNPIVFFLIIILPLLILFATQIKNLVLSFQSNKQQTQVDDEILKQFIEQQNKKNEDDKTK